MLLNEVINEIKDTFHSIDIRVFSHKKNDVWNCIFTVIRFRRETEEELRMIQEDLIKKCGSLIETEKFKVGIFHYPVKKWAKITDDLSKKFLCLTDSFAVNYDEAINFNNNVSEPHPEHGDYVYKNWKYFVSYSELRNSQRPNYHDELRSNVLENQFTDVDEYLSAVFQYDKYDFQRNPWIKTLVPTFFKTENIEFDHDKVIVDYTAYEQKNIQM